MPPISAASTVQNMRFQSKAHCRKNYLTWRASRWRTSRTSRWSTHSSIILQLMLWVVIALQMIDRRDGEMAHGRGNAA